jgi:RES domain-containing protein
LILWRISNHADLSGRGGRRAGGRWHTKGRPVVYLGESAAACLLEAVIHLEVEDVGELPADFCLLKILSPDNLRTDVIEESRLPRDLRRQQRVTRRLGDAWLKTDKTPFLKVPSAVVPETWHYLLNPAHRDARHVKVLAASHHPFDRRLIKVVGERNKR